MGEQLWTQGSEGRNLMLWSQLKSTEEEDEAKWSSKDELGVPLELGRGKSCKVASEGPVWEDCGIKWWATSIASQGPRRI